MALQEVLTHFGFTVDSSKLKSADVGVQGLIGKLKGLGGLVTGAAVAFVGAGVVSGVKDMIDHVTQEIDTLNDLSNQLNVSTTFLEGWGFAAQLSGSSAEALQVGIRKLSLAMADSAGGGAETSAVFAKLGINAQDAEKKIRSVEEILPEIAENFHKIPKGAAQAEAAVKLFGKGGVALIPLLNEGRDGIEKLTKEFEELHGSLSSNLIKDTAEMRDNLDRLKVANQGLQIQLVAFLVPGISKVVAWVAKGIGHFREWAAKVQLFERIGRVAVGGVVVALLKLSPAIISATAALAPFVLGWVAAFLIVDDFISFLEGEQSVMGDLLDAWFGAGTAETVRAWFYDLQAVISNFWDDFKTGAIIGVDSVLGTWLKFINDAMHGFGILKIAIGLITGDLALRFHESILSMQIAWNNFVASLKLPEGVADKFKVDISGSVGEITGIQTRQALRGGALADEEGRQLRDFRRAFGGDRADANGNVAPTAAVSTGPVRAPVTTTNFVELNPQVNVTVPPGTSAAQAKMIAREASNAVRSTTRATMASLEPSK